MFCVTVGNTYYHFSANERLFQTLPHSTLYLYWPLLCAKTLHGCGGEASIVLP
jgi:hypothetical protein